MLYTIGTHLVFDYKKGDWVGLCDNLLDENFTLCAEQMDVKEV